VSKLGRRSADNSDSPVVEFPKLVGVLPQVGPPRMKALIVDDSRTMRRLLASYLADFSIEAIEAEDGLHALEQLQKYTSLELALVDWDMPRMTGLELVKAIRASGLFPDMKILMISSHNTLTDVSQALSAGATDFLMKPMTEEMLRDKLQMLGVAA